MLKSWAVNLALVAGFLSVLSGMVTAGWQLFPWLRAADLGWFCLYLSLLCLISLLISRSRNLDLLTSGLLLALAIAFLCGEWSAVLFVPLFVLSCCITGQFIFSFFRTGYAGDPLFCFITGAGLLGTIVGLLAHFPVAYPALYAVILLLPPVARPQLALDMVRKIGFQTSGLRSNGSGKTGINPALLLVVGLALIHYCVAFMPELGFDALAMHLFVPAYMEERLQWQFNPEMYAWALMPMLGDWLYSLAYILAGETAARLVNLVFIYALGILIFRFSRWLGADRQAALWGVVIYLSTPLTFTESHSLFIDAIWTTFLLAAFFGLLRMKSEDSNTHQMILIGLFMGFAFAAKLGTLTFFPLLLLFWWYRGRTGQGIASWRSSTGFILSLICAGGIPYLTAYLISGNPVFPFFNAIFASDFYSATNFASIYLPFISWDLPYQITFATSRFLESSAGASGFQWLLLLPATLVAALCRFNGRALLLLLGSIATILLVFQAQSYLRYVFAALLVLISVFSWLISQASGKGQRQLIMVAVACCVALNLVFFTSGTWQYRALPMRVLFDQQARETFVTSVRPLRTLIPVINQLNVRNRPVAFITYDPAVAGMHADVLFTNWYNHRFFDEWRRAINDEEAIAAVLYQYGAEFVVLDETMVDEAFRHRVHTIGESVVQRGDFTLLKIKPEYMIGRELLTNGELDGTAGWELLGGAAYDPVADSLVVSEPDPAIQSIAVRPERSFTLAVSSSCHQEPATGRLQVNWYEKDGDFISTSITLFDCTNEAQVHSQMIQSPPRSAEAVVFLTAEDVTPIAVHSASFR